MRPPFLKYIALSIGTISVVTSVLFTNEATQFVKPFFHVFLYLFYIQTVKRNNPILFLFLLCAMLGEFLTAKDFESNYILIHCLFTCYFVLGTWMIWPVIKTADLKLKGQEIIIALLIVLPLLYVVYAITYYSMNEFTDSVFTIMACISFLLFTGTCFFVTLFHRHPQRLPLFMVGVGYFVVCIGYLVYELLLPSSLLMGGVNTLEIVAQYFFVVFLIHRQDMLMKIKWFI